MNSGGFMGYANDIYEIISSQEKIDDDEDDQLFYTKIFLNDTARVHSKLNSCIKYLFFMSDKMVDCT